MDSVTIKKAMDLQYACPVDMALISGGKHMVNLCNSGVKFYVFSNITYQSKRVSCLLCVRLNRWQFAYQIKAEN